MSIKIKIIVISTVIVVAASSIGFFTVHKSSTDVTKTLSPTTPKIAAPNTINYSAPTDAQKRAADAIKADASNKDTLATTKTSSNPAAQTLTISISRISQSAGSNTVNLRTTISGTTNGSCIANFSKEGQTSVQQAVSIISNPTYLSCAPIDVPVSRFAISGNWSVNIHIVDARNNTLSNTASSTVEVAK